MKVKALMLFGFSCEDRKKATRRCLLEFRNLSSDMRVVDKNTQRLKKLSVRPGLHVQLNCKGFPCDLFKTLTQNL